MIIRDHKRATISGDTTSCADCGCSWDTNDADPPACVPANREGAGRSRYREVRQRLQDYIDKTRAEHATKKRL